MVECKDHGANTIVKEIFDHRNNCSEALLMERQFGDASTLSNTRGSFRDSKQDHYTIFARHNVICGKESNFETWIKEIVRVQQENFPGYIGTEVVRSTAPSKTLKKDTSDEYICLYRYDSYPNFKFWMDSLERLTFLEQASYEFENGPIELSCHAMEFWFVNDATATRKINNEQKESSAVMKPKNDSPSKYKMVTVLFLLIWLQSHFIAVAINEIPQIPPLLAEALGILTVVVCTTYVWLPLITQYLLHWWFFPDPDKVCFLWPKKEEQVTMPNSNGRKSYCSSLQEESFTLKLALPSEDGQDKVEFRRNESIHL